MPITLSAEYAALPPQAFAALAPTPVASPSVIAINEALAETLGLDAATLSSEAGIALLAGNQVPGSLQPLAMAYSGHQFGHWSGQLGDGRAILLGETKAKDGQTYDIQLKGAGRTPFSRNGDGRSALGPVIREYIVSEAMAALGVPTTRALAALRTGEDVQRERFLPGGIFTRVAKSHVRVGTFQHFAAAQDSQALEALTAFCLQRLYPGHASQDPAENAEILLAKTVEAQAKLIARWMGLGFIHGVMNTDNMAISGETIDYGPCAFMEAYDPKTVFSSIDHQGRYAYENQPNIAHWNLACFASALIPLLGGEQDEAVTKAQTLLDVFPAQFERAYGEIMRAKLGLSAEREGDDAIIEGVLECMRSTSADFTNTFRAIALQSLDMSRDVRLRALQERWASEAQSPEERQKTMMAVNPAYIPRNHQVERAIRASVDDGDDAPFHALNAVLADPYNEQPGAQDFARPADPSEAVTQTFCGT
jgi:uncharacterized protein YdiU (UPF0061 family)